MFRLQKPTLDTNNRLYTKDMVELCLKPCKSDTFYTTIKVPLQNPEETVEFNVLIDLGARIDLIYKLLVKKHKLTKKKLDTPIAIQNGDGTIAKNK